MNKTKKNIMTIISFFCILLILFLIILISVKEDYKDNNYGKIRTANPNEVKIEILLDNDTILVNQTSINFTVVIINLSNDTLSLGSESYFSIRNIDNPNINISDYKKLTDNMLIILEPTEKRSYLKGEINTNTFYQNGKYAIKDIIGKYEIRFSFGDKYYNQTYFWIKE